VQVITSQTIPGILEQCGERFTECPLYRNRHAVTDAAPTAMGNIETVP